MKRLILSLFIFTAISLGQPDTSWTKTIGGSDSDIGSSVQRTTDGGYILTGYTRSFGNGQEDIWLIKIDSIGYVGISSIFSSPTSFNLSQNYPNPFNPVTTLRYDLPENGHVTITIYDMLGRQVKTLINQTQDAGYKSLIWDATNDYGTIRRICDNTICKCIPIYIRSR